ncbi:uncharacterized protein [Amphiura filiformis]|uniref:uncharacterized protein n=1 Tax=Amphiura filiformis TaxID=82378 RepID=UPI003B21B156
MTSMRYGPVQLSSPPGFQNILRLISQEVLRTQPENTMEFIAGFVQDLLEIRENTGYDPVQHGEMIERVKEQYHKLRYERQEKSVVETQDSSNDAGSQTPTADLAPPVNSPRSEPQEDPAPPDNSPRSEPQEDPSAAGLAPPVNSPGSEQQEDPSTADLSAPVNSPGSEAQEDPSTGDNVEDNTTAENEAEREGSADE